MMEHFAFSKKQTTVGLFVLSSIIAYASLTAESEAYHFPKLLSIVLILASIASLIEVFRQSDSEQLIRITSAQIKDFLPGFIVILLLINVAEDVGFYLSSWIFCIVVIGYYFHQIQKNLAETETPKSVLYQIIMPVVFSTIFIFLMYMLFSVALRVQTPLGLLF